LGYGLGCAGHHSYFRNTGFHPAKKHFPSDILIGGTLGYITGTYIAAH
jgi:hypothetical protein